MLARKDMTDRGWVGREMYRLLPVYPFIYQASINTFKSPCEKNKKKNTIPPPTKTFVICHEGIDFNMRR